MNLNLWNVLCTLVCVGISEAMRPGDVGVCLVQSKKHVRETYLDNNMNCGKDKKSKCPHPVIKKRFRFVDVEKPGCCEGYEYVADTASCQPSCLHGCLGGTCIAPKTCHCEPPLILINNKCVPPVCDPSCVNGNCTAPNTCTCNNGYLLKEDNFTCVAQCTDCENGRCTIPNVCECDEGFTLIGKKCKPVCKNECSNGFCSAPDVCSCNEGYKLRNNTCKPVCGVACVNANCVAPNVCECLTGYEAKDTSKEVCKPKCDTCVNGDCIGPNECSCHKGYALKDKVCRPTCDDTCVNATCVSPNNCDCFAGFEPTVAKGVCRPKCDSCINGDCIAPNECICHKGYVLKDNVCRPTCDNTCVNATCVSPNSCECLAGFEPTVAKGVCRPKCDSCINGDCIAPNECICRKGYALIDKVCTATCEDKCVNAKCVAPNKCECLVGFEPKFGHEAVCIPKCDSCVHGECTAPNKCVCRTSFTKIDNVCRPICDDTCVNAKCTAPNKCTCNEGYTRNVTKPSVCYKPCYDCGMGTCSLDGECICGADSKLVNATCVSLAGITASGMESTKGLASLEMSWLVGGAVGLLLVVLVIVVIQRTWRRQKDYGAKAIDSGATFGSVIYTVPNTLIRNNDTYTENDGIDEESNESDDEGTSEKLMTQPNGIV